MKQKIDVFPTPSKRPCSVTSVQVGLKGLAPLVESFNEYGLANLLGVLGDVGVLEMTLGVPGLRIPDGPGHSEATRFSFPESLVIA